MTMTEEEYQRDSAIEVVCEAIGEFLADSDLLEDYPVKHDEVLRDALLELACYYDNDR